MNVVKSYIHIYYIGTTKRRERKKNITFNCFSHKLTQSPLFIVVIVVVLVWYVRSGSLTIHIYSLLNKPFNCVHNKLPFYSSLSIVRERTPTTLHIQHNSHTILCVSYFFICSFFFKQKATSLPLTSQMSLYT